GLCRAGENPFVAAKFEGHVKGAGRSRSHVPSPIQGVKVTYLKETCTPRTPCCLHGIERTRSAAGRPGWASCLEKPEWPPGLLQRFVRRYPANPTDNLPSSHRATST